MSSAWRSKWLDWQPEDEIISVFPEIELTKLTKPYSVSFVSPIPGSPQIISAPSGCPERWPDSFTRWLDFACVRQKRSFTGLVSLHRAFGEWQTEHGDWTPTPDEMEKRLVELDFLVGEVAGSKLVAGLAFRDDLAAHEAFQVTPEEQVIPAAPASEVQRQPVLPSVRLVSWTPKAAPIHLPQGGVVADVELFIRRTLQQLVARLNGDDWSSGNWPIASLVERLAVCGCIVVIDDPEGDGQ